MPITHLSNPYQVTETGFNLTLSDNHDDNQRNLSKLVEEMRRTPEFEASNCEFKIWLSEENETPRLHFDKLGTFEKIWSHVTCSFATSQISPAAWQQLDKILSKDGSDSLNVYKENADSSLLEELLNFKYSSSSRIDPPQIRKMELEEEGMHSFEELNQALNPHELKSLMENDPDAAARMCYQKKGMDNQTFSCLLSNPKVREKVIAQLGSQRPDEQVVMAARVLNMGYNIPPSNHLPADVTTLLKTRRGIAQHYYDEKADKHGLSGERMADHPIAPYYYKSNKYLDNRAELNGKLYSKELTEPLNCRQLSQLMHEKHEGYKEFLQYITEQANRFLSPLDVRANHEIDAAFRINFEKPSIISDDKNFGRLLRDMQGLLEPGASAGCFLVACSHPDSHVLWLYLEKKQLDKNNTSMVKVGVFDANVTGNMKHIQCLPEDLSRLKLSDFLGNFMDTKGIEQYTASKTIAVIDGSEKITSHSTHDYVDKDRGIASVVPALMLGNAEHIRSVVQNLPLAGQVIEPAVLKELAFSLCMAMCEGHAKAVRALSPLLSHLKLDAKDLKTLLTGKVEGGATGLYTVLEKGDAETIESFGELLMQLNLREEDLKEILEAKRSDGVPGLYMAFQNNHAKAVEVFGSVLHKVNIRKEDLREILAAKAKDVKGLLMALQKRHTGVIEAYGKVLELNKSKLEINDMKSLLGDKELDQYAGVVMQQALKALRDKFAG